MKPLLSFRLDKRNAKKWSELSYTEKLKLWKDFQVTDRSTFSRVPDTGQEICFLDVGDCDVGFSHQTRLEFSYFVTRKLTKKPQVYGEVALSKHWAKKTGFSYRLEVPCPVGRVDILFDFLIVETKIVEHWKHALGQALAYRFYYRNIPAALLLLGDIPSDQGWITECCESYGVNVLWYDGSKTTEQTSIQELKKLEQTFKQKRFHTL